ncbi:MAG: hypothetical protein AB2A00_11315 [Myxococcota bacterium]
MYALSDEAKKKLKEPLPGDLRSATVAIKPEVELDVDGQAAVNVYVILNDTVAKKISTARTRSVLNRIRDEIGRRVSDVSPDLWTYVHFRGASEEKSRAYRTDR